MPPADGNRKIRQKSRLEKTMTMWYECTLDNQTPDEGTAHFRVPADSPWFDGHFPGSPVLPGIAQLGMVHDLLCRVLGRRLPVRQVSRVRFKQMIRPDERLTLTVRESGAGESHSFRITGSRGLVCSGQMRLDDAAP